MRNLTVTIAPDAGVSVPANAGPFLVDAVFRRVLPFRASRCSRAREGALRRGEWREAEDRRVSNRSAGS